MDDTTVMHIWTASTGISDIYISLYIYMKLGEGMMREYGEKWKGELRLDIVIFCYIYM